MNTVRLNVTPNVPHTIEINNFNAATPGFNDLFNYNLAGQKNVSVGAGKVRALTLKPALNYLKGFVRFTCDIKGVEAGQAVACQPNVDGSPLPPVNPRETAQFAIPNGDHNFHVDLVGPNTDLWAPPTADKPIKITGNRSTPLTLSFNRKGQLVTTSGRRAHWRTFSSTISRSRVRLPPDRSSSRQAATRSRAATSTIRRPMASIAGPMSKALELSDPTKPDRSRSIPGKNSCWASPM